MRRTAEVAVRAIAMYVALSLAFGVLMARLTLSPMRLPLPAKAQIALMYKAYGAELQTVAIQAADGVILQGWYVVPEHQNGQAVILLHGIGDNRGGVAGYGQAFLNQGYRILLPDFSYPIRGLTANRAAPSPPTDCSKATTFIAGCHGSTVKAPVA